MTLTRYNPFREFESFPAGLRLFEDTLNRFFAEPASARPWTPSVDVLESPDAVVLKADLPGISQNDIDIRIEDGTLTLKGERKLEERKNGEGYHRIERGYGSFVRCFSLPDSVDPEQVKAEYKNGVLAVSLPKKEAAKPRTVKVSVS